MLAFNKRVVSELRVPTHNFSVLGRRALLPRNPFQNEATPIILLPGDILRTLPIALDWDGVSSAAQENEAIRNRVNENIGAIWEARARRDKDELKKQALASSEAFKALLDAIHRVSKEPYDIHTDPLGLLRWAQTAEEFAKAHPIALKPPRTLDLSSVHAVVRAIVTQFRQLVEQNGLAKTLWFKRTPLKERYAQLLFFAVAYSYCKANNLDISPEVDSGNGQVDFKFSTGGDRRVLVEVKLSSNSNLVVGYSTQLEAYKAAEETMRAVYLVLDVGKMGTKDKRLVQLRNQVAMTGGPVSDLEFVDARLKPAASRR